MARNHGRYSSTARFSWRRSLRAVLAWMAALLIVFLMWVQTRAPMLSTSPGWAWLAIGATCALLTVALERGMAYTSLEFSWRSRLAFLASAGLPVILLLFLSINRLIVPTIQPDRPLHLGSLLVWSLCGVLGAFAGGLLLSGADGGLWEDNAPPPEDVKRIVHRRHVEIIGEPEPGSLSKRLFDIALALVGLLLSTPVWLVGIFLVWFEDPGPIMFVKNSVGRGGKNFRQFKLRTMVRGAEEATGPVLSLEGDKRVLSIGGFLRKTALDELPQLINILLGEMSFVGPRPQRTVLVQGYLEKMPEYAERHRVLPGLAGLAQVAGDYYLTPRQKLRFDRIYIRYAGLGFDIKLIILAAMIAFWYRWQDDWDGRIPRKLIRLGNRPTSSSR